MLRDYQQRTLAYNYVSVSPSGVNRNKEVFMECGQPDCSRAAVSRGFCDKHYRRLIKYGSPDAYGSRKVAEGNETERFHQKYEKQDNGCWIWTGGTRPNHRGTLYGRHHLDNGLAEGAHRFSYILVNGQISSGIYICHKCDTPLCVNPDHLFSSDHVGNMRDMVNKARSYKGRGEAKIGRAKLTNAQAETIRTMSLSQSKIGQMFDISQTTVGRIKRGESY